MNLKKPGKDPRSVKHNKYIILRYIKKSWSPVSPFDVNNKDIICCQLADVMMYIVANYDIMKSKLLSYIGSLFYQSHNLSEVITMSKFIKMTFDALVEQDVINYKSRKVLRLK